MLYTNPLGITSCRRFCASSLTKIEDFESSDLQWGSLTLVGFFHSGDQLRFFLSNPLEPKFIYESCFVIHLMQISTFLIPGLNGLMILSPGANNLQSVVQSTGKREQCFVHLTSTQHLAKTTGLPSGPNGDSLFQCRVLKGTGSQSVVSVSTYSGRLVVARLL